MEIMIRDEAASPALHRWLSFLRLLMSVHPRVGADAYAVHMGARPTYVPGWNMIHVAPGGEVPVNYIYIDPKGDQNKGLHTRERPEIPDDQFHHVHEVDIPVFESTAAWFQVTQLADIVADQKPEGIDPAWVRERMKILEARAQTPLRGEDPEANDRIAQSLARIRGLVNGPNASLAAFTDPIIEVVRDFLDFRLTRTQSSNILAVLFARYAISFPSPLDRTGGADVVKKQIDHLIGLTSTIIRDRQKYDLGSFCLLTYLGQLWGEAALIMARQLSERSEGEALRHWFGRRALYVDELAVHELEPTLMHPVDYMPFGVPEYQRTSTVGLTNRTGLYAGAGDLAEGPFDPEAVWERLKVYSASAERLTPDLGPYVEFFPREMTDHLTMFLVTMKMGQAMK